MINFFSNSTNQITSEFESIDRRYKYSLYLISCYFDIDSALELIKHTLSTNNINEIHIYIDRNESYRIGYDNLKVFLKRVRQSISMRRCGCDVKLFAVKGNPGIFHSKIFALINYNQNLEINNGKIILGSANLTRMGLMADNGNIETTYTTTRKSDLRSFVSSLAQLEQRKVAIEDLYQFDIDSDEEAYDWQYALLNSGFFIHKWSDSLSNDLSAKFMLTERGRELIQNNTLEHQGFYGNTKSISKNYFSFEYLECYPSYLGGDRDFIKKHGLEVYLGYWVPKGALYINKDYEFETFKKSLVKELKSQQNEILKQIKYDISWLQDNDFISRKYTTDYFSDKFIISIEKNDLKIMRIYTKYEIFEMPYSFSQDLEVNTLYDQVLTTKDNKPKKQVSRKIDMALDSKDLRHLANQEDYYS